MVKFKTSLKKFEAQGEKTGWTYIDVPIDLANKLKPGIKTAYRVKGKIDHFSIAQVSLVLMGAGNFILAINGAMRKGIGKRAGAMVDVELLPDDSEIEINPDLIACLADDPVAEKFFLSLPRGHRNYFSKWIDSAKTEETRVKRITQAVTALGKKMVYGEMVRESRR